MAGMARMARTGTTTTTMGGATGEEKEVAQAWCYSGEGQDAGRTGHTERDAIRWGEDPQSQRSAFVVGVAFLITFRIAPQLFDSPKHLNFGMNFWSQSLLYLLTRSTS